MKFFTGSTVLVLLVATSFAQSGNEREVNQESEQVETVSSEAGRDKRGFIITPLSALPAAALAPLLPYLRAVVPPPLLNKVAAILPPAQLVEANTASEALRGVLTATAPLAVDRAAAAAAAAPVVPAPQVLSGSRIVVPAAPPVVPAPVVTAARLVAGSTPVVTSTPAVVSPSRLVLPATSQFTPTIVPGPATFVTTAGLTGPSFFPSSRLTAVPFGAAPGVASYYTLANVPTPFPYNYAAQFAQLRSGVQSAFVV